MVLITHFHPVMSGGETSASGYPAFSMVEGWSLLLSESWSAAMVAWLAGWILKFLISYMQTRSMSAIPGCS